MILVLCPANIDHDIMKRHFALLELSREHHSTLSLAQKIIRSVNARDESAVAQLAEAVKDFENVLVEHFQKEELGVFQLLSNNYPEHRTAVREYLDEHKTLLSYARTAALTPSLQHLEAFAILLRDHTRREERVLFPLVESCFSEAELMSLSLEQDEGPSNPKTK